MITGEFKDLSEKKVRSFPAAEVADHVLDLYTDVAEGYPLTFPPVTFGPLAPLADELGHLGDGRAEHYKRLDSLFEHAQSQLVEGRHGRYIHARPRPGRGAAPRGVHAGLPLLRPVPERSERARAVGRHRSREGSAGTEAARLRLPRLRRCLGDYPLLLRPLGLAIDLLVKTDPAIQARGPASRPRRPAG